jgi:hypothetical protein
MSSNNEVTVFIILFFVTKNICLPKLGMILITREKLKKIFLFIAPVTILCSEGNVPAIGTTRRYWSLL